MTRLSVTEYLCHREQRIYYVYRSDNPTLLYSFMTCHRILYTSNRTSATSGAGTAYTSEASSSHPFCVQLVLLILWLSVLWMIDYMFVLFIFLLPIVLPVLRPFTDMCKIIIFFLVIWFFMTIYISSLCISNPNVWNYLIVVFHTPLICYESEYLD